mmetsp:Transcript_17686/g.22989  ORF Transcript_17686/g.22989 Transcript_17686/m.22989 type:complete len:437 (+) Transcript_17686:101-1411(+)
MTQVSRPVMLDFSEIFTNNSVSPSSPVKQRLENWAPSRPQAETVAQSLATATVRREEVIGNKKAKASRETKAAGSKADAVKKAKTLEAEQLAALISSKVEAALARAESFKNERAIKGSKMSANKVEELRKEEKISTEFTREMNEKRHAEALQRAESFKNEISKKCASMNVSKTTEMKQKFQSIAESKRSSQSKRHESANLRAESAKRARSLIGGVMSVPKVDVVKQKEQLITQEKKRAQQQRHALALARVEAMKKAAIEKASKMSEGKVDVVKQATEELTSEMKQSQAERHAQAEMRAEEAKKKIAIKGEKIMAKVKAARAAHFNLLEKALEEKRLINVERQQAAIQRNQDVKAVKKEKAHRMSVRQDHSSSPKPTNTSNISTEESSSTPTKKVVTLRKDSPKGAHVVSIIAPNDDKDQAEVVASEVVSCSQTSNM